MLWYFVYFFVVGVTSAVLHMPPYLKPCSRSHNFTSCAMKHAEEAIPFLIKGDKKLGLPRFNPLKITEIKIKGANKFAIDLKNLKVYGLENTKPLKLQVDFKKRRTQILSTIPTLTVLGNYTMDGKILIFKLNGHGAVNLTLTNGLYEYGYEWDLENRDGIDYGRIIKSNFDYHLKGVHYDFENVINGEKEMSVQINQVLNQNWQVVNDDLKDSIKETLLVIHNTIFSKIFTKIPINELFLE